MENWINSGREISQAKDGEKTMANQDLNLIQEKYARLICEVGLNLQPGQKLFIWANQLEVAPLVRQVMKIAYLMGSPLVSVLYNDETAVQTRFEHAPRDSFNEYASWKTDARLKAMQEGEAVLWIGGPDPDLLQGYDPELIAQATRAYGKHFQPIRELISKNASQWLLVCPPTPSWAVRVFPEDSRELAERKLWDAVIQACRLDQPDPCQFWKAYLDKLEARATRLTKLQYQALRYRAPGTDLEVGLPSGHIWIGGWDYTGAGIQFCGNLPTEEIFTMPHREQVNGHVKATYPLSYQGGLIDDFEITFQNGRVEDFSAGAGEELLCAMLNSDENARYLGEAALVPHGSPISSLNLVFLNTLYDENASNHLALGNAYRVNLEGAAEMDLESFQALGGNTSLIHVDFMFGSGEMDVDGVKPDGTSEPLMRAGEWVWD